MQEKPKEPDGALFWAWKERKMTMPFVLEGLAYLQCTNRGVQPAFTEEAFPADQVKQDPRPQIQQKHT